MRRRFIMWLTGGLLIILLVFRVWSVIWFAHDKLSIGADAHAYFAAAHAIQAGVDPVGIQLNPFLPGTTFPIARYLYPPLLALLLVPLTLIPFSSGLVLWLVLVAITTLMLAGVLRHWLGWRLALGAVFLFLPTWESLWLGQINPFIALLGALTLITATRPSVWPGVWLAIGVLIKLMPGVGLLVLVAHRRWRAVVIAACLILFCVALTLLVVPPTVWINGVSFAASETRTNSVYVSWTAILHRIPGSVGTVAPMILSLLLVGVTLIRGSAVDLQLSLAAALLLPLLIGTIVWEAQIITALPCLAVIWSRSRRGQIIAGMAWLAATLIGGIFTPLMLTLCWVGCCWPQVLTDRGWMQRSVLTQAQA